MKNLFGKFLAGIMIVSMVAVVGCGKTNKNKSVDPINDNFMNSMSEISGLFSEMHDVIIDMQQAEKEFEEAESQEQKTAIYEKIKVQLNEKDKSDFYYDTVQETMDKIESKMNFDEKVNLIGAYEETINKQDVTKEELTQCLDNLNELLNFFNDEVNKKYNTEEYINRMNDLINQCNEKIAEIDKKAADEAAAIAKAEEEKKKQEEKKKEQQPQPTTKSTQPKEETTQPSTQSQESSERTEESILASVGFQKGQTVYFKGVNGITGILKYLSDWEKIEVRVENLNININEWKTCSHGYQVPISCYECISGSGGHGARCSSDLDGNGMIESLEKRYYYKEGIGFYVVISINEIY